MPTNDENGNDTKISEDKDNKKNPLLSAKNVTFRHRSWSEVEREMEDSKSTKKAPQREVKDSESKTKAPEPSRPKRRF